MTFLHPIWLLLLIPLIISLCVWKPPSCLLEGLRIAILTLILLAMCGLAVKLPSRTGTVVVVADRSQSMPADSEIKQKEAIDLIQGAMRSDSNLAVVSLAETLPLNIPPKRKIHRICQRGLGERASDLNGAIEKAMALIPQDAPGRVLLLSDGRWTGKDPSGIAAQAAARGITLDYRAMQRASANDVAISHIDAPETVNPGESFMLAAWIHAPVRMKFRLSCSVQTNV